MIFESPEKRRMILQWCCAIVALISLAIFSATCAATIWVLGLLERRDVEREINCATYDARPIPESVMKNLCDNNLIPISLGACDGRVLQLQDIGTIVRSNLVQNVDTYDDVSRIFDAYEIHCEIPSQRRANYSCIYDISGVGPSIYIFYNSETHSVESIRVTSC